MKRFLAAAVALALFLYALLEGRAQPGLLGISFMACVVIFGFLYLTRKHPSVTP